VKEAQEELITYQATKLQEIVTQLLHQRGLREELSDLLGDLDVAISMAQLAHQQQWTKPILHT